MKQLIEAINNYQEKTGLSTCELANKLGLHFVTLYRMKQGKRGAGTKVLRALSQIPQLQKAINDFISGDDSSPRPYSNKLWAKSRRVRKWLRALVSRDIEIP